MQALRARFGSSNLVTAAITADGTNGGKIDAADYGGAAQYVDWYNVDDLRLLRRLRRRTGPTAPHSPLTSYAGIPTAGLPLRRGDPEAKSKGVPSTQAAAGHRLLRPRLDRRHPGRARRHGHRRRRRAPTRRASRTTRSSRTRCPATGTVGRHGVRQLRQQVVELRHPGTIGGKMTYAKKQGLGGAFFWELSGDTVERRADHRHGERPGLITS